MLGLIYALTESMCRLPINTTAALKEVNMAVSDEDAHVARLKV